jgi:hypothetical protein
MRSARLVDGRLSVERAGSDVSINDAKSAERKRRWRTDKDGFALKTPVLSGFIKWMRRSGRL